MAESVHASVTNQVRWYNFSDVEVYTNECRSRIIIYHWISQFKHGQKSVSKDDRSGCPCVNWRKSEKFSEIVRLGSRIIIMELSDELNINRSPSHSILNEYDIHKLAFRFVSHFLITTVYESRLLICIENIDIFQQIESKRKFMERKFKVKQVLRKLSEEQFIESV